MSDWLHNLPLAWMATVLFLASYLTAAGIYFLVAVLARGAGARSLKAVSPSMLPSLGIIFGLFVAFTAAQVWGDTDRAVAAVNQEAAALRKVEVFARSFAGEPEARLNALVRDYIQDSVQREWPLMARRSATFGTVPAPLSAALDLDLGLQPTSRGQEIAQREIAEALESAVTAHRQRVNVSDAQVNGVKWTCLIVQALCALFAIAAVHSGDRLASAITLGLFASGVAACFLLIVAHDRPFTGEVSVSPAPLIRVMPSG